MGAALRMVLSELSPCDVLLFTAMPFKATSNQTSLLFHWNMCLTEDVLCYIIYDTRVKRSMNPMQARLQRIFDFGTCWQYVLYWKG